MWVIFSVLAAFCWGVSFIIDKYVLTKWAKSPFPPIVILGIFGLAASAAVFFINGFAQLSNFYIFLSVIAGAIWGLSTIFYFRAAKIEEISRIVPLYYLSPLFISIFAGIFLGEILSVVEYFGIFLLIIGAILISSKNFLKIRVGKAFWMIILSVLFFAISSVILKYLLNFADYWTVFSYMRIGAVLALAPIMFLYFPELMQISQKYGKKVILAISASEIMNLAALVFVAIAASIGYITLVNALTSLNSFFVLSLAVILSMFFPSILKEEIGKSVVAQKILAIGLMFIGVILIT